MLLQKPNFEAIRSHNKVEIGISSEILLNVSLSSWNARFGLTMICATRETDFAAIRSDKVEIDISFEILLNVLLSSWNARFGLTLIGSARKRYFEAIRSDKHFNWDLAQCVAFEPNRAF